MDKSNKITKFYASNQGETHITDSDNGKIQDMVLYGKSEQNQYKGINLLPTGISYGEIIEVSIPKGTRIFWVTDGTPAIGGNFKFYNEDKTQEMWFGVDAGKTTMTGTTDIDAKYMEFLINETSLVKICLGIGDDPVYEPYTGGQPSPSPDYPQEIKSVVNPTVKVSNEDGTKSQTVTLLDTLNAIPVSSGGNVTIDGQQYVADYVDVERGKIVRNVENVTFNGAENENWELWNADKEKIWSFMFVNSLKTFTNESVSKCNRFEFNVNESIDRTFWLCNPSGMPSLQIKNRIIGKDITAFKSWLSNNPINVIYPLRIPIEEELTAEHAQALKELATYYPVTNISIGSEQLDGYTVFNYPVSMKNGLDYVKKPIFTNYIPVKKNTQYVYGLSTENQLPAHKIRYFNSDGTYLKEVELSNVSQNGLKTITFDDDYLIQLTFPDGLTDENKKNFKFEEENNMTVKAGNQITLVDITDAYSVMLTSEAYTFVGGTGGVGANQSCTTEAVAFCGNNQCSVVTVDAKSIVCPTGISAAVSNSGTPKVTIKFTTTATVNAACEATIPVSVDGITINKKFSFAVARTGNTGATGKGIKGTPVTEYVASTGNTTPPTSGWSTSIPSVDQGQYLWTRVTTTYTDNTTSVSYSVAKQGSTGATGTTGSQWYAGTGITGTSTTATAFADSGVANARVNDMYLNTSTGNTYKCTVAGNATNAKWIYAGNIKGVQGDKGNTGATGNGISKADITYASSSSNTSAPTSGWQSTPPSVSPGQYLWTKTVFTYTNGGTATQYSVAKQGNTGAAGADAITVSITSSNGTVFKNNSGSTVLTAHVYKGAVEQTVADNGTVSGLGTIKWYKVGSDTAVATAKTLTVSANDVDNTQAYTCQLEG